jgi:hypothetical protein
LPEMTINMAQVVVPKAFIVPATSNGPG